MHLLSTLVLAGCLIVSLSRRSVFKELIFCCWQKKRGGEGRVTVWISVKQIVKVTKNFNLV